MIVDISSDTLHAIEAYQDAQWNTFFIGLY